MVRGGVDISELRFRHPGARREFVVDAFAVEPGERCAIVGPSGSGKTTLLHLIAGILVPAVGEIRVSGERIDRLGSAVRRRFRRDRIGLVFQEFELLEHLTAAQNIELPRLIGARVDDDARAATIEFATSLGLGPLLDAKPGSMSQGERQRVAICRSVLTRPDVILADEPTGNLDPDRAIQVARALTGAARESEATLLVVTHDPRVLDEFDRTIELESCTHWDDPRTAAAEAS